MTNDLDTTVEFHGVPIIARAEGQTVRMKTLTDVGFNSLEEFFDACRQARDETLAKIDQAEQSGCVDLVVTLRSAIVDATDLYQSDLARAEEVIDRLSAAGWEIVRKGGGE